MAFLENAKNGFLHLNCVQLWNFVEYIEVDMLKTVLKPFKIHVKRWPMIQSEISTDYPPPGKTQNTTDKPLLNT